jgi:hypothetical protein
MVGLTNLQVEKIGKKLIGDSFLGVYPSDSIPSIKNINNNSIIFNLSTHSEPGSHYVAVLFNKNKIYYFDSYGKKLSNKHIKNNLKQYKLPIFYHTRTIQDNNSIFCGLFTLAYLRAIQKLKLNPAQFYEMFYHPPNKKNDKIVTKFLLMK